MGAFLDKPKTDKLNENGGGNGLKFGLSSMQGWRVEMEDSHSAVIGLPGGLDSWSFFAVFDGHAGGKVSAYSSDKLLDSITGTEEFKSGKVTTNSAAAEGKNDVVENIKKALRTGFLALDDRIRELPEIVSGEDKSGSTAVSVMLSPEQIFFANCGDSRGILCSDGQVTFATQDHKPINPEEKARIQNAGGSVMIQRVNGSLAVSRALGDFEYKNVQGKGQCEQLVSPEPEVFDITRRPSKDEFVVLACDGIWDVMSNDELCSFVRDRLRLTDDLKNICNQVVDTCLYKGSRDNMSIVIITLPGAQGVSEEAIQRERALDARLEEKVKEILAQADPLSKTALLPYVLHLLSIADIEGLPPGGGLSAKKNTIEEIVNRLNPPTPTPSD